MLKKKIIKSETDILFQSSANSKKNRINPLDCLTGFEPEKKISKIEYIHFIVENVKEKFKNYKKKITLIYDKKKNPIKFKNESINKYSEYYKLMYVSKSADHNKLLKLLNFYGSPDFQNPYSKENIEYHYYNEYGFIATEIEAILSFMFLRMEKKDHIIDLIENEIIDEENNYIKKEKYYNQAIKSLAYIFYYGDEFDYLIKNIHKDNLEMCIIEIAINLDFSNLDFNKEDFFNNLKCKSLIKKENIEKLILLKKL